MNTPPADSALMREAIALGWRGDYGTSPNPMVGCLVVRDGRVVGRGFHRRAGGPHAEVLAIGDAGDAATGADLYVTLEPCAFTGRTPACTELLLRVRPRRVVVACSDPNPRVDGRGVDRLRQAGIEVTVGVEAARAAPLIRDFALWVTRGRPSVTAKWASSLDGRVTGPSGRGGRLSGDAAAAYSHRLRHQHDAIAVGVATVLADDPRLTNRGGGRQPRPVVIDSRLRTPPASRLFDGATPPLLLATAAAPADRRRQLEGRGAEVVIVAGEEHVDLVAAWQAMADRDLISLLLEGGPRLITAALRLGLVDRLAVVVAPLLIGGGPALPALAASLGDDLDLLPRLHDVAVVSLGDEVVITASL